MISGHVTDPQSAAVANADVHVINQETLVKIDAKTDAKTDEAGAYTVPYLPLGRYQVTIEAQGFTPFISQDVILTAGQGETVSAQLAVVGVKEEVNIQSGGAAQIETEKAELSGTITQKEVTTYGLNGRNFSQLIALAPGVSNQTGQDEGKVGVVGSVKYSVNGGRVEYNTFEVDGSDVLNTGLNGAASTLVVYPSLDAIQEVKVLTSNYGAQFGRTASGTVQVTTRSGGDKIRGNLYEFLRNEVFNSRNYFDQTAHAPLYRRHDFGGTVGGPLTIPGIYNTKKDKTFFFFSEEVRLEKSPTQYNQAVPSLKERELISTPQGIQPNLQPTADGSGRLQQVFDFTDVCPLPGSAEATKAPLSGAVSQPDSFGAVTMSLIAGFSTLPIQLTGYIVDSKNIKLAAFPDPNTGLGYSVGGSAIGQGVAAGTFHTNSAFSGPNVYGILGQRQSMTASGEGPIWASATWAGLFTADGAGHLTSGLADQDVGGAVVSDTLTGTYSVDAAGSGRVTAATTFGSAGAGPSFVFYLTGTGGPVLVLDTDTTGTGGGIVYPRASASPSFSGAYGVGFVAGDGTEASGQMTADGAGGTLTGQISVDAFGDANPFAGAFATSANGRFAGSLTLPNGTPAGVFYIADPTQGFFIENDDVQVSLGYFSAQSPLQ
jgi:hypothetical protein